jgi:decaprenylphospho-beta-D-ribofuranose 2-oxidase
VSSAPLSGWGGFPRHEVQVRAPRDEAELRACLRSGRAIARGSGRAYGDSAVGRGATIDMRRFDRMVAFDEGTGQLVAEAGVRLSEVIDAFLPHGWFPLVTPGTKFVTLGGMAAADVHGKNHHRDGSFAGSVDWLDLMDADGEVQRCSRAENAELFDWTLGGMGLTGVILRLAVRLRRVETAWIRQTTIPALDLDAALDAFERADSATYSVAWIDCLAQGRHLGRSLVMLGEHADWTDLPEAARWRPFDAGRRPRLSVPVHAPGGLLNAWTVRAFNRLYYWAGVRRAGTRLVDWDSYFYPLDSILGWNRIYGRKGFVQFQCVLPLERSREGLRALLGEISEAGQGSFLAVLKRLGPGRGGMSFPMAGYTLALDFPVRPETLALMDRLDRTAVAQGGRFYLAKDARMMADTLRRSDARALDLRRWREEAGLRTTFASAQSERLDL